MNTLKVNAAEVSDVVAETVLDRVEVRPNPIGALATKFVDELPGTTNEHPLVPVVQEFPPDNPLDVVSTTWVPLSVPPPGPGTL